MRPYAIFAASVTLILAAAGAAFGQPSQGFADLNDRLSPAVVNIATAQRVGAGDGLPVFPPGSPLERFNDMLGEGPRMARSLGSGFIIDGAGLVITNNPVIEAADAVEVVLPDGRVLPAQGSGRDPATDLAVLRVDAGEVRPHVVFGDSDAARAGDWVVAIGNPFGLGGSLTVGVISARGRD
ncbi:MAG: trypsin-like peptidase domain-containing protein, partial [Oceanicaulis sp.]|nr:trypsin-like peptidase domain-containing protein [Oceanicaulis sp.]